VIKRHLLSTALAAAALAACGLAAAQDIEERTLKLALAAPDVHPAVAAHVETPAKNGMAVTQFNATEIARLRERMKPGIANYTASVGEPLVAEVQAELARLRK